MQTPEPKKVDVRTWYNRGSARFRIELDMEFDTPAVAQALDDEITATRKRIEAGGKPKLQLKLWTE